jgi:hypothetical protein
VRDAGSEIGETSRSVPGSVRLPSAGTTTAHAFVSRAIFRFDSGTLTRISRSAECAMRTTGWPEETTWPGSASIAVTTPFASDFSTWKSTALRAWVCCASAAFSRALAASNDACWRSSEAWLM